MKKKLYLDPTGVSSPEQQHMAMGSSEQGISMCHSCGMWPMTASTEAMGQSWRKVWAPAPQSLEVWTGPSTSQGLLVTMGAATMSSPQLLYRELRNLFYLEITDPS